MPSEISYHPIPSIPSHPNPLKAYEHLSLSMVIWNGPSRQRQINVDQGRSSGSFRHSRLQELHLSIILIIMIILIITITIIMTIDIVIIIIISFWLSKLPELQLWITQIIIMSSTTSPSVGLFWAQIANAGRTACSSVSLNLIRLKLSANVYKNFGWHGVY